MYGGIAGEVDSPATEGSFAFRRWYEHPRNDETFASHVLTVTGVIQRASQMKKQRVGETGCRR